MPLSEITRTRPNTKSKKLSMEIFADVPDTAQFLTPPRLSARVPDAQRVPQKEEADVVWMAAKDLRVGAAR